MLCRTRFLYFYMYISFLPMASCSKQNIRKKTETKMKCQLHKKNVYTQGPRGATGRPRGAGGEPSTRENREFTSEKSLLRRSRSALIRRENCANSDIFTLSKFCLRAMASHALSNIFRAVALASPPSLSQIRTSAPRLA